MVRNQRRVRNLVQSFRRTWQRPPTGSGLDGPVQDDMREAVLYREVIAHMLDQSVTEDARQVKPMSSKGGISARIGSEMAAITR